MSTDPSVKAAFSKQNSNEEKSWLERVGLVQNQESVEARNHRLALRFNTPTRNWVDTNNKEDKSGVASATLPRN